MDLTPVTLRGRHVELRPLARGDLDALWEAARYPDLWRYTMSRVERPGDLSAYVDRALDDAARGTALPFVTVDRASGRVAGSTRFMNVSVPDRRVEIGATFLAPGFQRTALNTEAKYLMLRHAFEAWGCVRVELKTSALNERSRAAIRRLGAVEEGTLRRHMRQQDGTWRDTVYFSVLDAEWPGVRAGLEARLARPEP